MIDRLDKDPDNWWGPFYACRKDPRLFVEKNDFSIGWGWTFNWANPYTYIVLVGIVLVTIAAMKIL